MLNDLLLVIGLVLFVVVFYYFNINNPSVISNANLFGNSFSYNFMNSIFIGIWSLYAGIPLIPLLIQFTIKKNLIKSFVALIRFQILIVLVPLLFGTFFWMEGTLIPSRLPNDDNSIVITGVIILIFLIVSILIAIGLYVFLLRNSERIQKKSKILLFLLLLSLFLLAVNFYIQVNIGCFLYPSYPTFIGMQFSCWLN